MPEITEVPSSLLFTENQLATDIPSDTLHKTLGDYDFPLQSIQRKEFSSLRRKVAFK